MGELFSQYNVLGAFGITIVLTVLSALGALVIGTVVAIMRVSPVGFLNKLGALYVNLVRNTPLTLIIVFCNIGFIVNLGMSVSDDFARNNLVWATIGLAFYHAAFVCEALRSGVNTVPAGQAEAAARSG
jgi:glutamate transport system permease protein